MCRTSWKSAFAASKSWMSSYSRTSLSSKVFLKSPNKSGSRITYSVTSGKCSSSRVRMCFCKIHKALDSGIRARLFVTNKILQAQWTITNTKWFDYKTNMDVRSLTRYNLLYRRPQMTGQARNKEEEEKVGRHKSTTTHLNDFLVGVADEPVEDDPYTLVAPHANKLVRLGEHVQGGETETAVDTRQVSQVEDVMEL